MNRKGTTICLSFVLVFSLIVIIVEIAPVVEAPTIIYVGSGVGNHTASIQDAIDNFAIPGDTVYVYSGVYYENVVVSKTINLTGENRDTTIINGSWNGDTVHVSADLVNVSGFTTKNGGNQSFPPEVDAGIDIWADNCKVFNNNIISNNYSGISIVGNWNNITDNNISDNAGPGIHISWPPVFSYGNTISNNTFFNNTGGVYSEECPKNTVKDNVFLNNGYGGIILPYSNDWIISGNTFMNNGTGIGIHLNGAHNITISNNTILHHNCGIALGEASGGNNIEGNNISNCRVGIDFNRYSAGNNITYNNIYSNTGCGLSLSYCCGWNNITGNIISSNHGCGMSLIDHPNENKIIGNTISSNNGYGMWVEDSSANNITGNNIYSNTDWSILLIFNSDWNNVTNNMISNNSLGIYIGFDALNNRIYHNDFINNNNSNSPQVIDNSNNGNFWDNGYPSGGNYWSDFDEPSEGAYDDYKGPDQDIPGSDDIIDNGTVGGGGKNPYVIDVNSRDNYPIMGPFSKCMILKQGWNLISIPLTQNEQTLSKVLDPIGGLYSAVQWYDNSDPSDPWKNHKVGKPFGNDLKKLNETMGFWVYITEPGDTIFQYNGTIPTQNQTITLHPGWNMVGYPSLTSYNRTQGLNKLTFGQEVDSIWTYDAATQKWDEIGPSDHFKLGRGYWIHATTTCEWKVPL